MDKVTEKQIWQRVTEELDTEQKTLTASLSQTLRNSPSHLATLFSCYKFISKMTPHNSTILELGCGEGVGAPILAEFAKRYLGQDREEAGIVQANKNWKNHNRNFIQKDLSGEQHDTFDTVICLEPDPSFDEFNALFQTIASSLLQNGICFVGTTSILHLQQYLLPNMSTLFHNVLSFGMHEEIIHAGIKENSDYFLLLGCYKKSEPLPKTELKVRTPNNFSTSSLATKTATENPISFGKYCSYWLDHSPRRFLHHLSYYKFAAKIIGKNRRVLDVGCNEGMGTHLLSVACGEARGIDLDEEAITSAKNNWATATTSFLCADFLEAAPEKYDALTNFDVIEHFLPEHMEKWWLQITEHLAHDGVAIIGTPSLASKEYASKVTNLGHVNLYSHERLEKEMREYFSHVYIFAANDEVIHTGFMPLAHYYIAIGCQKR